MNRIVSFSLTAATLMLLATSCQKTKEKEIPVASVGLNRVSLTLVTGETETLIATVLPENATDKSIRWNSSSPTVAKVEEGVVTALSEGTTTITAFASRKMASCLVTVSKRIVAVESVTLDKEEMVLKVGDTETLVATVHPDDATDKTVSWSSSDEGVATVTDGLVTAVAAGSATITATAGGKSASCPVTVETNEKNGEGTLEDFEVDDFPYGETPETIAVTSVILNKTSLNLEKGEHETLTATILPDNATDKTVSWASSAPDVASVADGIVTALAEGTATITATAGEKSASCAVTVREIQPATPPEGGTVEDFITDPYPYEEDSVEEFNDTTPWLVTSDDIDRFLREVTYTDTDFSVSHVTEYPGGPGEADIPPTYTISWTAKPEAGSLNVRVWEGSWSRDYSLAAGASQLGLTNLVPGRTYRYVVSSSEKQLAKGSFITTGTLHQVYFDSKVRNGRDLGGWTGAGGKTVAFRKIYRGGRLDGSYMSSAGKAEMRHFVQAEIDLREEGVAASSSPLGSDIAFYAPIFASGYNHMVKDNPGKVAACFTFIVNCLREGKSVYFHCSAGRDRTGTLSAILLGLLGVNVSDVSKDYELTYFAPAYWSMLNGEYQHPRTSWGFKSMFKTLAETGESTLQQQIEKLLLDNGVTQQDITDFQTMMLE